MPDWPFRPFPLASAYQRWRPPLSLGGVGGGAEREKRVTIHSYVEPKKSYSLLRINFGGTIVENVGWILAQEHKRSSSMFSLIPTWCAHPRASTSFILVTVTSCYHLLQRVTSCNALTGSRLHIRPNCLAIKVWPRGNKIFHKCEKGFFNKSLKDATDAA